MLLLLTVLSGFVLSASVCRGQENGAKWNSYGQNFKNHPLNRDIWGYTGVNPRDLIANEPEGLHISVPGNPDAKAKPEPLGIVAQCEGRNLSVVGDFEITVSYELLRADTPTTTFGAGVALYVMTNPAGPKKAAQLSRANYAAGPAYVCAFNYGQAPNRKYENPGGRIATTDNAGKLRLVRRGKQVTFLVAPEGSNDFQPPSKEKADKTTIEFGDEDLHTIRVTADSGDKALPVEVRVREFTIRAANVPQLFFADSAKGTAAGESPSPQANTPQNAEERGWLLVILEVIGLVFFLAFVGTLGTWLYLRQGGRSVLPAHATIRDTPAELAAAPSPISFHCGSCGKHLKAKAELAGKKVKCSECGQPVLVPEHTAGEISPSR